MLMRKYITTLLYTSHVLAKPPILVGLKIKEAIMIISNLCLFSIRIFKLEILILLSMKID